MRKILLFISVIIIAVSCKNTSNECVLKADLGKDVKGKVTIYPYKRYSSWDEAKKHCTNITINEGSINKIIDSTKVVRTGSAKVNGKGYGLFFFSEPGEINFQIKGNKIIASGTPLNDEYNLLVEKLKIDRFNKLKYKHNLSSEDSAFKEDFINNLWKELDKKPNSIVLSSLFHSLFYGADIPTLNKIINSFSKEIYKTFYLADLIKKRDAAEASAVGMKAPYFTLQTKEGKTLSLSDYKGKYLLIDFWASWCGPCRQMIPEVKKIYKAFHSKGLEVLNVSLDAKEKDWLKALEKEQMPWSQVRDTKKIADIYNVNAIPDMFLIDKNGKILARGIHGKAIWDELAKYGFKK
jgi:thiol-disulfide isomerase/thioredoxin